MRKLIYAINLTLDGCCEHTKFSGDDEILEHFAVLMRDVGVLVYGRKTYELMVPYWPDIARKPSGETRAAIGFARVFDALDKVVFSRSLAGAEGRNTRIVGTAPEEEIRKLKREQGKDILLGGVELPSQLIKAGLVDEYHFVVHPVIVGEGRRLLEGVSLKERLHLKLVESTTLNSGPVALHYSRQ
jgi:dihydrofolate reductase